MTKDYNPVLVYTNEIGMIVFIEEDNSTSDQGSFANKKVKVFMLDGELEERYFRYYEIFYEVVP